MMMKRRQNCHRQGYYYYYYYKYNYNYNNYCYFFYRSAAGHKVHILKRVMPTNDLLNEHFPKR